MKNSGLSLTCQEGIREACAVLRSSCDESVFMRTSSSNSAMTEYESEFGRMLYTISILLMFSFVIVLLMVRSIKRTHSTVEMDALLDAMRFREELDIRDRQRRRLMKAKTKVTAWLNRNQTNQQAQTETQPTAVNKERGRKHSTSSTKVRQRQHNSISTVASEIPEIVVSFDECNTNCCLNRPNTPAISLIYDFGVDENGRRKSSVTSTIDAVTSSSSSSISSNENRSIKGNNNNRTFSLEASSSSASRRVNMDDKSISLDS